MLIRLLFWFILFYLLLRFLIRVVIPVVTATKDAGAKMKDINENMNGYHSAGHSATPKDKSSASHSNTSSAKGDYIDFEEIK